MAEKLAINGGPKAVTLLPPKWPILTLEDVEVVINVMRSQEICAPGRPAGVIGELEDEFKAYQGRKYALAVNSGTAALDIAVAIAEVGPGDEVIVSPYTWGSTVGCIIHNNGIPVFVDIDSQTYNIDPDKIEEQITPQTKAIVVVHIYGHPADMDPLMTIAGKYNLVVIEDCAQAHSATYRGKKVGSIGHIGCFSIGDGKHVTGGEAGILVLDDDELFEKALLEGTHPGRHGSQLRNEELKKYMDSLGWNYRIHPLAAAIAKVQLKRLDADTAMRQKNLGYLSEGLRQIPGIEPPYVAPDCTHSYHMYSPSYVAEELDGLPREKYIEALNAEGVGIFSYVGTPIHLRPRHLEHRFYGKGCPWECPHVKRQINYKRGDCPVAEERCEKTELNLGTTPFCAVSLEYLDQLLRAFKKVAENVGQIK